MTVHTMSDKELKRLDTIKRLQEKALTRAQAAELLGLSVRQVQRLSTLYRQLGVAVRDIVLSSASCYPGKRENSDRGVWSPIISRRYRILNPVFLL